MPPAPLAPSDLDIAARTLYGEARGESDVGKEAVAWVIRNRTEDKRRRYGSGVTGVCLKKWQFSCWNENDPNSAKLRDPKPIVSRSFTACQKAVQRVFADLVPDPTGGACHYQVTGTGASWAKGRTPRLIVGAHEFYTGVDK